MKVIHAAYLVIMSCVVASQTAPGSMAPTIDNPCMIDPTVEPTLPPTMDLLESAVNATNAAGVAIVTLLDKIKNDSVLAPYEYNYSIQQSLQGLPIAHEATNVSVSNMAALLKQHYNDTSIHVLNLQVAIEEQVRYDNGKYNTELQNIQTYLYACLCRANMLVKSLKDNVTQYLNSSVFYCNYYDMNDDRLRNMRTLMLISQGKLLLNVQRTNYETMINVTSTVCIEGLGSWNAHLGIISCVAATIYNPCMMDPTVEPTLPSTIDLLKSAIDAVNTAYISVINLMDKFKNDTQLVAWEYNEIVQGNLTVPGLSIAHEATNVRVSNMAAILQQHFNETSKHILYLQFAIDEQVEFENGKYKAELQNIQTYLYACLCKANMLVKSLKVNVTQYLNSSVVPFHFKDILVIKIRYMRNLRLINLGKILMNVQRANYEALINATSNVCLEDPSSWNTNLGVISCVNPNNHAQIFGVPTIHNPCQTNPTVEPMLPPTIVLLNSAVTASSAAIMSITILMEKIKSDGLITALEYNNSVRENLSLPGLSIAHEATNVSASNMVVILKQHFNDTSKHIMYLQVAIEEQVEYDQGKYKTELQNIHSDLYSCLCKANMLVKSLRDNVTQYLDSNVVPSNVKNKSDDKRRYKRNLIMINQGRLLMEAQQADYTTMINIMSNMG